VWDLHKLSIYNFNRLTKDVQTIMDVEGLTGLSPMPTELDMMEMSKREQEWLNRNKNGR
jgi:hypothetical protein